MLSSLWKYEMSAVVGGPKMKTRIFFDGQLRFFFGQEMAWFFGNLRAHNSETQIFGFFFARMDWALWGPESAEILVLVENKKYLLTVYENELPCMRPKKCCRVWSSMRFNLSFKATKCNHKHLNTMWIDTIKHFRILNINSIYHVLILFILIYHN
jgi:hypothetical protein